MELVESKYAPLLDQPLTREAELLLKTGRMLSRTAEWRSELLLRITTSNGVHDLVLHPQRGVLASKRTKDGELRLALAASLDALGYYSTHLPTKFECPPPSTWLTLKMEYSLNAQGEDDERPFIVSFAPGVESERPEHSNLPFGIQLTVEPAAIVAIAELPGTRATWTDDRLTLDNNHGHLVVDARDGRLLSYENSRDGIHLAVEHRPGAYEEQWKEICEGTQHQPNAFDAQRPYSSTLAFLYQEGVVYDLLDTIDSETDWRKRLQGDVEALRVARRLVELGMFERMDQLEVARKSGAEFRIPSVPGETSQPIQWLPLIARVAVPWADELFPRKSWLWTVWRETCFVVAGQTEYTGPQLQALYGSSDIGPVGCLVISSLTSRVNVDLAERFATRGLWRCEVEEFRKDYAPLLNRDYPFGACLHRTAQVMRELTEDECSQLASSIAAEYRPALLQFAARLRESRDRPVEDTLPSALDEAWEAGLRDLVKAGLTRAQPKGAFRVTHAPSSSRVD
jgi:hypothetical protein